jgi:hypothetical protein
LVSMLEGKRGMTIREIGDLDLSHICLRSNNAKMVG